MIVIYRGLSIECVMIRNNFFIPIITIALISSGFAISDSYAHTFPPGCIGSTLVENIFRTPGTILDGGVVDIIVTLDNLNVNGCDVEDFPVDLFVPGADGLVSGTSISLCNPADAGAATPPNCDWDAGAGGTEVCYVSDDGNAALTNICPGTATIFEIPALAVTVDVDPGVTQGDFNVFGVNVVGLHLGTGGDNVGITKDVNVSIQNLYTIDTMSTPNGDVEFADIPTSVSDKVTINGFETLLGDWSITKAELWKDENGDTALIAEEAAVVCVTDPSNGVVNYPLMITCTANGLALDANTNYCWIIWVAESSGNYDPATKKHNACIFAGDPPRVSDTDERFFLKPPPPFDLDTLSDPTGVIEFDGTPVETASDTITVSDTDGVLGNFVVTKAELWKDIDGASVLVADLNDFITCDDPLNTSIYDATSTILCTYSGGGALMTNVQHCWNIIVQDTLGNHDPDTEEHNGCEFAGDETPRLDDGDEQFFLNPPPPYDFTTLSDPQGDDQSDVKVVTDTITIDGFNGLEGDFSATATLYLDGEALPVDDDDAMVECEDSAEMDATVTTDMFPNMDMVCTWDRTAGDALLAGTYCWMVTVVDENGNYDPVSVTHNACAVSGDDNEFDEFENFTVEGAAGCTPGYWKQPHHFWAWESSLPGDSLFDAGFDTDNGINENTTTLLQALKFGGGKGELGAEKILLRAAVAALLNEESSQIMYGIAGVVAAANIAMDSNDRQIMLTQAGLFDAANNEPDDWDEELDGKWCPIGREPENGPT